MKLRLSLVLASLVVTGALLGADDSPIKIVKPQRALPVAKGTAVKGTISFAALPTQLQQLTCDDLTVHVGILHSGAATLTSIASSKATGTISSGQCTFHVNDRLPAGGPFDVVIVRNETESACKLSDQRSAGQVTLTRGTASELNVQLTPVCETN